MKKINRVKINFKIKEKNDYDLINWSNYLILAKFRLVNVAQQRRQEETTKLYKYSK